MLPDGDMVRMRSITTGSPGVGGGVERVSYSGTTQWGFSFSRATLTPHHDIEVLPNGNVPMVL
ncbi:MAG: hypothetical protein ACI841_005293 [Planctomycetota bacterium]|jgi:hypothetical protein